ncbi:DUF6708 domain-containing protein [Enterobacter quasiroggenkampii]|uniref:DUF6708 domain-containing protein n=1 Tax=Enterobacter quasiroggenkampii TaxID=2497436 RepID=UPI0021CFA536|nr:DUF6708 domain-containing protein [Enterobacter quasiroggenkampii]MCU6384831.1 hypothetical protein [Enterobacter quasiroggenkampii]MCU6392332.1 hypothetical protein [Enterobacter quasiroggenkampii]MCU6403300.1 hypothetical protein [Enterobacter quasiroggenkampii]MCU6417129.1 hypothetical protein [Enterobacter quasiroggenkampii]
MTMYGLYQPYKINRPLTKEEKNNQFKQGKHRKVKALYCGESVIHMNSTYLEIVDKFYKNKGVDSLWGLMIFVGFIGILLYVIFRGVTDLIAMHGLGKFSLACLMVLPFIAFGGYFVFKEWFKWTHYPIRFNRRNGMVYVFRTNGTVLCAPWKEIFFTQEKEPGPLREWCIRGHILDKDGEMVLETFSLGICGAKGLLPGYWEFIRCYMEEDLTSELADIIIVCPPIENRREGFVFGFQNLIYMYSRMEWISLIWMLPMSMVGSIARYIASQTSKIPQWPQEVLDACKPDVDDSVNVSADNNPKDMWRLVFANQKYEDWKMLGERHEVALSKINDILTKRYGSQ